MKNIIQIVILVLIGTPIFAERHSPEFWQKLWVMVNYYMSLTTDFLNAICADSKDTGD